MKSVESGQNGVVSSAPRLLLLSGDVDARHAGEVFLRDLCASYPRERLFRVALTRQRNCTADSEWMGFPVLNLPYPRDHGMQRFGSRFERWTSLPVQMGARRIQIPPLARRAAEFGRAHQVEMVWATLCYPGYIALARRVAEMLRVPLVSTVWDPPERFADELRFSSMARRDLLHQFEKTVRASARVAVASEGMREEYRKRYGRDSIVMIVGADPRLRRPPARGLTDDRRLVIGVAGSIYARETWLALLRALDSVNWRIAGRDVTVRVLCAGIVLETPGPANVEFLGWRSAADTIEALSQTDLCYVPYWFEPQRSLYVRVCFPGKIVSYLAAGRPIFYHGPADSSPARFLQKYPAGLGCHSLDPRDIVAGLERFAADPAFYASAAQAGQKALDEELNRRVFLDRFAQLVGIRPGQLSADAAV